MKKKITKIALSSLSVFLFLFLIGSCNKDDDSGFGNFDLAELQMTLGEARDLLSNTQEGTMAGDQQPGSKAILESVIAWIEKRINTSDSQADIDDAGLKLNAAIQTYMESVVATAFPWIQQEPGAMILVSENIRSVISNEFTIQGEFYVVDLNERAFFNNLFALNGFPANGFTVRYSADGTTRLLTGDGAWQDSSISAPGTFVTGEWIDVAYTNDGSTQKLFVNGVEIISMDKNMVIPDGDISLAIGNSPVFLDRPGNVLARNFSIWNTVLSPEQISANVNAEFDGTEANLEAYFPLGSDLGDSFEDVTGNYTATLMGDAIWVSEPPIIVLDYTALDAAIQEITEFRGTVVEGDQDGDYPVGTISYIDELIASATDIRANDGRQTVLDDTATSLSTSITLINNTLVADAAGVYIDSEDPGAVGMRITPNYTPQGDYTYEFDLRLKTLELPQFGWGDIMGNGTIGFRVNGYQELTEENLLNAGGGWNWTNTGTFIGPMYPALTLKSAVWQHIAIVHDDTDRTTKIFVDGVMVGESTDIGAPVVSGNLEIWLGNAFGAKMNGSIKDFRIWDSVRTEAELDVNITGSESDLQLYFPLDRVKGIKFTDATGNYNGEMRGVVWNN